MKKMNRREFLTLTGASVALLAARKPRYWKPSKNTVQQPG